MRIAALAVLSAVTLNTGTVAGVLKNTGDLTLSEKPATVHSNSVNLPVNLSYKSNIKIHQRASWVGLGFDLDVSYIERIAVGSADERSYRG